MINKNTKKAWWEPAMEVFLKISIWIAVPVILSLFLGKYLDNRYDTRPWFFLGLTGIAFITSTFGIIKESIAYIDSIDKNVSQEGLNDVNIKQ